MDNQFQPAFSTFDPCEGMQKRKQHSGRRATSDPISFQDVDRPKRSAFQRIAQLCAYRERSRHELEKRLKQDGYDDDSIHQALDRACEFNLVNDIRFADALIRTRKSAGKGKLSVERDLLDHAIDPCSVQGWPSSYGFDDECQIERAVSFLKTHPSRAKDIKAAGYRKLVSRGYAPEIAYRALRAWANRL